MIKQVSNARVSEDKNKLEGIDERRISLPIFSSDLGKDVPNYLRVSTGSCHDFCKFGKETTVVRQNPPWTRIQKAVVEHNLVPSKGLPIVKKAKADRIKTSNKQPHKISKPEISPELSFKQSASNEKEIKAPEEKFLKEKLSLRKTSMTGSSMSEKLNKDVGKGIGNRRDTKTVNKHNERSRNDLVTKSSKAPSTYTLRKPPSSPCPPKLATKDKKPTSSKPLPLTPTTKVRPRSSLTQLKGRSVGTNPSPSSAATKLTTASVTTFPTRNMNVKKVLNNKDQTVKTREACKVRASELANRRGSFSYKSKTATNVTRKELQVQKLADAERNEFNGAEEEEQNHAAAFGNEEVMESDDEVPEKTLYVIRVETGNNTQPPLCAEEEIADMHFFASLPPPLSPRSPTKVTASNVTSNHEVKNYEPKKIDTSFLCADESPYMQPLTSPSSPISLKYPSSIAASTTTSLYEESQDETYTESEEGYFSHEDDHLVEGENLKSADNTKLKKSATNCLQDHNKDPVKLKFRRGRVVDIKQEHDGPIRLRFSKERVLENNTVKDIARKSSYKMTEATQDNAALDNSSGTVVLRHQDVQDKKDAQGLLNNVIEETASKLVETRKSKVKALVGAFETVISLQDSKPATR